MPAGLIAVALALFAEASAAPASAPAAPVRKPVASDCSTQRPTPDAREIVICAPKIEGYRIDPDVMQARREIRSGGPPKRPERMVDRSCASVGPRGCGQQAGINLVGAALTAATMVGKAAKGENVGQMFITDPHPSEYQLYLEAKARREAREAEKKAAAAAARARSEAAVPSQQADPTSE